MSHSLLVVLSIAIPSTLALVITLQALKLRRLQRRMDVHSEALRMLAQPAHVELPPEPPSKPDLRLLKGGKSAVMMLAALVTATVAWTRQHAGPLGAVAAGAAAALLVFLLIPAGRPAPRQPFTALPTGRDTLGLTADRTSIPTSPPGSTPPPAPRTFTVQPSFGVQPVSLIQPPSTSAEAPHPRRSPSAPPPRRPSPSPSAPQASSSPFAVPSGTPCPIGLTLRLDPLLRVSVCA